MEERNAVVFLKTAGLATSLNAQVSKTVACRMIIHISSNNNCMIAN